MKVTLDLLNVLGNVNKAQIGVQSVEKWCFPRKSKQNY